LAGFLLWNNTSSQILLFNYASSLQQGDHTGCFFVPSGRHWLDVGAQPSETVSSLLRQIGIVPMIDFNKKEKPYYGSRKKKDGDKKSKKALAMLFTPHIAGVAQRIEAPAIQSFDSSFRGTAIVAKPSFRMQPAGGLCAIRLSGRVLGARTSSLRSMSMLGMQNALQRVACACGI
jgi:hypothetical protein